MEIEFHESFIPAIMSGAKTQTRRPVNVPMSLDIERIKSKGKAFEMYSSDGSPLGEIVSPYGEAGDTVLIKGHRIAIRHDNVWVERVQQVTEDHAREVSSVSDGSGATYRMVWVYDFSVVNISE